MSVILTADRRWQPAGLASLDPISDRDRKILSGGSVKASYDKIAKANPWVLSAWTARAGLAARVPVHVFRRADDGDVVRVRRSDDHRAAVLARLVGHVADPARATSSLRWCRLVLRDLLVHGQSGTEVLLRGSDVVGLRRHRWVDVDPHDDLEGYRIDERTVDRAQLVHWRLIEADDGKEGVSPLESLDATHELHDIASKFARKFLDQGVFPSGAVEMDPKSNLTQATATRKVIEAAHAGPHNAGKPLVMFGTWKQIAADPDGAKLVELSRQSREEVGAAYRVPMSILGDARDTNKATAEADRTRFIRDVVGDDVSTFEAELNAQLASRFGADVHVECQLGELLRPDMEAMAKVIRAEVGGPVVTANEARTKWLGLQRLDDPAADRLNLAPGTESGRDEEPPDDDE